jgi:mRNA interferase RelE/StbE
LDTNSSKNIQLSIHAVTMGKELGNFHNTKLTGYQKIKLPEAGIRIVYKITGEKVDVLEIVLILAIQKRKDFQYLKLQING